VQVWFGRGCLNDCCCKSDCYRPDERDGNDTRHDSKRFTSSKQLAQWNSPKVLFRDKWSLLVTNQSRGTRNGILTWKCVKSLKQPVSRCIKKKGWETTRVNHICNKWRRGSITVIALTEPPSHKVIINVIEGMEGEKQSTRRILYLA
jgi:hypothetical protein